MHNMNSAATSFTQEIESMMHGFGDVANPLRPSAELIQTLVHRELCEFLRKAESIAEMRMSGKVDMEEVVFLLRNNKFKLRRLYKSLVVHSLGTKLQQEENAESEFDKILNKKERQVKKFVESLECIDNTGELMDFCKQEPEPDEARTERLVRLERLSRDLDAAKYEAFAKARSVKFPGGKRGISKFIQWASAGYETAFIISESAWAVLEFLCFECIGEIMDVVFLLRRTGYTSDTIQSRLPALTANPGFPAVHTNNIGLSCEGSLGFPVRQEEIVEAYRRLTTKVSPLGSWEVFTKLILV